MVVENSKWRNESDQHYTNKVVCKNGMNEKAQQIFIQNIKTSGGTWCKHRKIEKSRVGIQIIRQKKITSEFDKQHPNFKKQIELEKLANVL